MYNRIQTSFSFISLVTLCLVLSMPVQAETIKIYQRNIISIYDGDTFIITKPKRSCAFDVLCKSLPVRLLGIDTPEIKGHCELEKIKAKEARDYLVHRLKSGHNIQIRSVKRDKHFRIDGDLFIDGKNIAQEMIDKGLGVSYDGGRRGGWCSL